MKRSHKVRVTKKDVYLTDDNLGENITELKKKESKNYKLLVQAPKAKHPVSLN